MIPPTLIEFWNIERTSKISTFELLNELMECLQFAFFSELPFFLEVFFCSENSRNPISPVAVALAASALQNICTFPKFFSQPHLSVIAPLCTELPELLGPAFDVLGPAPKLCEELVDRCGTRIGDRHRWKVTGDVDEWRDGRWLAGERLVEGPEEMHDLGGWRDEVEVENELVDELES